MKSHAGGGLGSRTSVSPRGQIILAGGQCGECPLPDEIIM